MTRSTKRWALLAAAALGGATVAAPAPALAIPVFDVTNYAQNLLQASRALEQINHQIQSLQNQATMIAAMKRNLEGTDFPQLSRLGSTLRQIDRLMAKARGLDFKVDQLDGQFQALFPQGAAGTLGAASRIAGARARFDAAMDGFRHSMSVQSQVVANVHDDAAILSQLAERSQGAVGGLQAQQAANQLLALSAKQQLQLQELIAAEFRSESIERARRAQEELEAQGATRRFLGSGNAYTRLRN